ncbi:MAG: CvpA family protein [Planctomycetota bacterium]
MADPEKPRRRKRKKHEPVKMPWWMLYPLILGAVAGVVHFLRLGDAVSAVVVLTVLVAAFLGFRMGVSTLLVSVLGLATAYWVAPPWGIAIEDRFAGLFGTSGVTNRCLSIGTVALVLSLLVTTLASMLLGGFLARRRKLDNTDRYLGLLVGVGEALFIVILIMAAFVRFNLGDRLGARAEKIGAAIDKSAILPLATRLDPLKHLPVMNRVDELQRSVQYLREPQNVNALLRDPRVAELREQPEYQSAVRDLRNDPAVSDFFDRGETIDRDTLIRLMNSDAVLRMLDQKEFLKRVSEVLKDKVAI